MAELDVTVSETILFYEYLQGNDFNGLEWQELVEDGFDLTHFVYHVWNDLIEETFDFSEAFTPLHLLILSEKFNLEEQFGLPIQVSATSVQALYDPPARSVDIAFFGLEVLHGVDIFWEEVSSGWHGTSFTKGVPYYWLEAIDYLGLDNFDVLVKVCFAQSLDRLNMRHEVNQIYEFNNMILDRFFIYDWAKIGWGLHTEDGFEYASEAAHFLGFSIFEYLFTQTESNAYWTGKHNIDDKFFIFDRAKQIQGFEDILNDGIDIEAALKIPYFDRLISGLTYSSDLELTNTVTAVVLNEFLKAQAAITIGLKVSLGIQEKTAFSDESLITLTQDYISTIEDGFGISVESVSSFLSFRVIQDAIEYNCDTNSKSLVIDELIESIGFTGEIN